MDKKMASDILSTLNESSFVIDKTLSEIKGKCPDDSFRECALLLGTLMADMFDSTIAPIYDENPDLAPEWYRNGPPRTRDDIPTLKLAPENHQALVDAFAAAYEKVQSLLGTTSAISDPREATMMRHGLHQISVSISHAQMTLLAADLTVSC